MASSETKIDGVVILQMSTTGSSYLTPALFYGGMSGSLQTLVDGKSYLVAGANVTITSQSNGQIVIAASLPASSGSSSSSAPAGFFGDGKDGPAIFDGSATPVGSTKNSSTSYTINRDVCYNTMDVRGTVTVHTNGYRVFCNSYAVISGTFGNPGNAGGTPAAGASVTGTLGLGAAGGRGQDTSPWYGYGESIGLSYGGNGGAGPTGNPGGTTYAPSASNGTVHTMGSNLGTLGAIFGAQGWSLINGGAGGAGTNQGSALGGGGGAGGGIVALAAFQLRGTGSITAQGGRGGVSDFDSYFGAGGGGGGVIFLATTDSGSWSGQLNVSGGLPGAATVSSGSAGTSGSIFVFNL